MKTLARFWFLKLKKSKVIFKIQVMKKEAVLFILFLIISLPGFSQLTSRHETDLSGSGWNLWRDKKSNWAKNDKHLYIYHDKSGKYKRDDDPQVANDEVPGKISIEQLRTELSGNIPTCGWDNLESNKEASVSVPGTVDGYLWGINGSEPYNENGAYLGVSWWWRNITIPDNWKGKKIILKVRATNYRAEIFVDNQLVRYDMVAGTPYEVDITGYIKPGETKRLAFRITNPGGSFNWDDNTQLLWGEAGIKIFPDHGFSGINGKVALVAVNPVYVSDIYMENTPDENYRKVKCHVTLRNESGKKTSGELHLIIKERGSETVMFSKKLPVTAKAGDSQFTEEIIVPDAKLWDIYQGNLYTCTAELLSSAGADRAETDFGFRWFTVKGYAKTPDETGNFNANYYLNGKRIRLLSAISWGFWPVNGLFATKEMAELNVQQCKKLGNNMLYHHRHLPDEAVFQPADQAGILNLCEMGGIERVHKDARYMPMEARTGGVLVPFNQALNRQKVLRAVVRDRNHPSVVIHTMVNEAVVHPMEEQVKDMEDAHALSPDRIVVWGGGQTFTVGGHENESSGVKTWFNSGEKGQKTFGWSDYHNTNSKQAWGDAMYNNPADYIKYSIYNKEIRAFSEEGAVGSPNRYDLIQKYFDMNHGIPKGWDGMEFIRRYSLMKEGLIESGMGNYYSVSSLLDQLGNKTYYLQGRRIENFKISNANDMYATNGWENDKHSSLSGLVDIYRNIKAGDITLLTDYTKPLYIAVKLRSKVVHTKETSIADFYLVNEGAIPATMGTLVVSYVAPDGNEKIIKTVENLSVKGGDVFSELLLEGLEIPVSAQPGYSEVKASFILTDNRIIRGRDQLFSVNWKDTKLPRNGAIFGDDKLVNPFLSKEFGFGLPKYNASLQNLSYIICYGASIRELPAELLNRVKQEGIKLLLLEAEKAECAKLDELGVLDNPGEWKSMNGASWLGGSFFHGKDKILEGLPEEKVWDWELHKAYLHPTEWDGSVEDRYHYTAKFANIKPIVAAWNGEAPADVFFHSALFAKKYGKGTILVSSIPMMKSLTTTEKGTDTMIRLFLNMIVNEPDCVNE